jgi:hypothetical protein
MPKTDSLQGSLDLLVLKILSRRPRLHGYAIMSAIQNMSGEVLRVEEGSLLSGAPPDGGRRVDSCQVGHERHGAAGAHV